MNFIEDKNEENIKLSSCSIKLSAVAQAETVTEQARTKSLLNGADQIQRQNDLSYQMTRVQIVEPATWDRRNLFSNVAFKIIAKAKLGMSLHEEEELILSDRFYVFSKLGSTFYCYSIL